MIEKLFTSKTRTKILTLLLFNQDKEYHLREIARLINKSPIYTKKELDNLTRLNIINQTKKANLNIYRINKNCIFIDDLRNIFLKTEYIGDVLKKKLKNSAKYCLIYGSFARGTETQKSDIDLLIISEINENKLISIIQKIENIIKREINYVLWNENTFIQRAKQGNHLLRTIKKNKIIMLMGNENEFREEIQ